MSLSVTLDLMISVMDISDAFLQVVQKEFVVIEVPSWIREILGREDLVYWKLLRCLPGQRNAALEWRKHFSSLCAKFLFYPYKGGTIYRHEKGRQFLSVRVDDIILVAEEQDHYKFLEHFSKILKMKADGPYGTSLPGTLFYLKRKLTFDERGLEIAASSKYVPKLLSVLKLQDRRGRGAPSHSSLDVFDATVAREDERLNSEESKLFRSALGLCLYLSQERIDIQHSVRILSTYMASPTKAAMAAINKLTKSLQTTQDMVLRFEKTEEQGSVFCRWKHLSSEQVRRGAHAHCLELFSDSDWASSKASKKSALSSMEAEVLAATSLLAEGIALKQALQFLLGCKEDTGDNSKVEMKMFLDSTSAQAFFQRLGLGRAKHLCTRILWGQEAMRRGWYKIGRIPTKENPADLNTKALSRERREHLARLIGLHSDSFQPTSIPGVHRIVQMLTVAGLLKGCSPVEDNCDGMKTAEVQSTWCICLLSITVLFLLFVMSVMVFRIQKIRVALARYRTAWKEVRAELNPPRRDDPLRHADEDAHHEGEGEEEEGNEDDDEFPDDRGPNGEDSIDDDGYIYGRSHSTRTSTPRRRITQKSNGDAAAGRGASTGNDVEAEDRPSRVVQTEEVHTMEAPDEQDDKEEEKEDEKEDEKKRKKTEGDDEEEGEHQEASSSSSCVLSSRGPDADATANEEANIFRPSISDRVATSLLNFGVNPANYICREEGSSMKAMGQRFHSLWHVGI